MEKVKSVLITVLTMIGMIFLLPHTAQAEDITFEWHSPYERGVEIIAGGSGNYYGENDHVVKSHYCVDLNAPDNSGYNVIAIAGGTVVADGPNSAYHTYYDYDLGDPVYAVANGTVVDSTEYGSNSWGNLVRIRHLIQI